MAACWFFVNQGQRSKVKVKKWENMSFWAIFSNRGSAWFRLGLGRVMSGTIGNLPIFFGMMPKVTGQHGRPCGVVPYCWQVANVMGKLATDIYPWAKHRKWDARHEKIIHISYNSDSKKTNVTASILWPQAYCDRKHTVTARRVYYSPYLNAGMMSYNEARHSCDGRTQRQ